jgi:hypothetical protein
MSIIDSLPESEDLDNNYTITVIKDVINEG